MPQLAIDEYLSPVTGSFLVINGYPVRAREISGEPVEIGERERAFSGAYRSSRRALKHSWRMRTRPLVRSEAEAVKGLLMGDGHYWSFDTDLYSSKGLGPNAGYTATQSTTGGLYSGKVSITSITYAAGLPTDDWTVLVARYSGTAWEQYAVRADAAKWKDGSRNDALDTSWLSVSGWGLTLTETRDVVGESVGTGDGATTTFTVDYTPVVANSQTVYVDGVAKTEGTDYTFDDATGTITFATAPASGAVITADYTYWTAMDYDELIALPYLATDQQIVAWHGLTIPFSPLPRLNATGDLVRRPAENPLSVECDVTGIEIVGFAQNGSWNKDGMTLEFTLEEV